MRKIIQNTYGDTIIEVLICIVILGVILTGAYVTSNSSLRSIREAQDKIQALGIAQGQVEDLRALAATQIGSPTSNYATGAKTFCFTGSPATITLVSSGNCKLTTFPINYTVVITGSGATAPATTINFKIQVSWLSPVQDQTTDYVTLYYRVSV